MPEYQRSEVFRTLTGQCEEDSGSEVCSKVLPFQGKSVRPDKYKMKMSVFVAVRVSLVLVQIHLNLPLIMINDFSLMG